jgi:hypothetical protein
MPGYFIQPLTIWSNPTLAHLSISSSMNALWRLFYERSSSDAMNEWVMVCLAKSRITSILPRISSFPIPDGILMTKRGTIDVWRERLQMADKQISSDTPVSLLHPNKSISIGDGVDGNNAFHRKIGV